MFTCFIHAESFLFLTKYKKRRRIRIYLICSCIMDQILFIYSFIVATAFFFYIVFIKRKSTKLKIAVSLKTLMTRTPTVDQGLVVILNSTHLTHFRNLPGGDKQSMSDIESTPSPLTSWELYTMASLVVLLCVLGTVAAQSCQIHSDSK